MKSLRRRPASSTCPPVPSRVAAIPACRVHGHRFNARAAASTQLARKPEYVRQRRFPSPSSTQTVNSAYSAPRASFRVAKLTDFARPAPLSAPAVLRAGGCTPACLLSTVHRIKARAQKRVEQAFLREIRRVTGKENILLKMTEAALESPEETVREVIYAAAGGVGVLLQLLLEYKAGGTTYSRTGGWSSGPPTPATTGAV